MESIALNNYHIQKSFLPTGSHTSFAKNGLFHSFLSDYIKQDFAETSSRIKHIVDLLK